MSSTLLQYSKIEKISKKLHTQKNGPSGALKSHNAEKLKGGPFEVFQHPFCRNLCYAEKQEKPFWFSSLDQIVHFDAIIFCRTFVELFWSVRVDRKKESL